MENVYHTQNQIISNVYKERGGGDRRKKVMLGRGGVEGGDLKGSNTDALKMK